MLLRTFLEAERQHEADMAIRREREAKRHQAPHWMFGERRPDQGGIQHPAHHVRKQIRRACRP